MEEKDDCFVLEEEGWHVSERLHGGLIGRSIGRTNGPVHDSASWLRGAARRSRMLVLLGVVRGWLVRDACFFTLHDCSLTYTEHTQLCAREGGGSAQGGRRDSLGAL